MRLNFTLVLLLTFFTVKGQLTLDKIGQTPGGSGFHVNYDSSSQRLFVGCGGSVRMYDSSQPDTLIMIGHRPFFSLINETYVDGNTLFVAANHDGFWAIDITKPEMPVLGHYPTGGDSAAFDIDIYNDTLYFANARKAIELTFSPETGFHKIREFGTGNVMCVERRNDLVAVGSRMFLKGQVAIYDVSNTTNPLASWSDPLVAHLEDLQFADGNDSIIYLCGGNSNGAMRGEFWALQFSGTSLDPIDRFTIDGFIPGIASANITNMDSRNDTLYLATLAGLYNFETTVPVLDASGLPNDSMLVIDHIRPGLWHFDVSLADGTDYLAISSEWIGFIWRDLNNPVPWDTTEVYMTGGWGNSSRLRGDTLWVAMEGYGIAAYKLNDLYYSSGYIQNQELLNIFTQFVASFCFVDDTLVWLSNHELYNLKPWFDGGQPILEAKVAGAGIGTGIAETALGKRVVSSTYNTLWGLDIGGELRLYDPYDTPDYPLLSSKKVEGAPFTFAIEDDSVWVGAQINSVWSIAVYKVEADSFRLVAHAPAPGKVYSVSKDGNRIAVGCKLGGTAWYNFDGTDLNQEGSIPAFVHNVIDVKIKNNYLYIADQKDGLFIYDLAVPENPVLAAQSSGSGGWDNAFGSRGIDVGADGKIYLTDFHVGTMIIEVFDTSLVNVVQKEMYIPKSSIAVYPNPTKNTVRFASTGEAFNDAQITLYDMQGRMVFRKNHIVGRHITISTESLKAGFYLYEVSDTNIETVNGILVKE